MNSKKDLRFINNRGQSLIITMIFGSLLIGVAMGTLKFSRCVERKITLQNGTDAALLSATAVLADGLNQISKLNLKLVRYHKWLIAVKAGKILTSNAGLQLTEEGLKKMIRLTALKQDLLKQTLPIKATYIAMTTARNHKTPHLAIFPLVVRYAIEREPERFGLPRPYFLHPQHQLKHEWSGKNFYYDGAYRATGRSTLIGLDLFTPNWKGVLIE